ncbi:hypothetical protein EKO04_007859 [Ascochyta lentis]|uniref:Zn(2)-C6 fungal-type domain-containing protein n=1 Tax=Ascochyta lentis TaxID=205686 RepID=A0A8H7IXS3_9PLEO|nr:hypothetical protein EKO04_007859 [Ascochyta lentis]
MFAKTPLTLNIQCDEEKPQCLHCVRHNISCTYRQTSTATSDVSSVEDLSPRSDSSWQFVGQDDIFPNVVSAVGGTPKDLFEMSDMALLHHWITVGGHSILNTHELDHFWHSVIPSVGFKHQHVIHSVLSISALHIAHTSPPDRSNFLLIAAEHRSKALDGFTEDLQNVGPENCNALFANATLTFLYAFISFGRMFDEEHTDTKNRTTRILGGEWIPLVRGTAAVLHPIHEHVREGPLSALLELYNFEDLDPTDDTHTSAYSDQLLAAQEIWAADEHAEVYNETLRVLLKCSAWMALFDGSTEVRLGYNRLCSGPFIWIFTVPEKYLVLQHQRQPPALIIFAFYGVLLHRLNNYWWAEGCGKNIVGAVDECLGPYWSSWMDWPKQAVGLV